MTERRVALVTGCGKADGVGNATARRLAEDGFDLVVTDYAPGGVPNLGQEAPEGDGLQALVAELEGLGARALGLLGDVGDPEDVARLYNDVEREFGRLDVLVNNAGAPQGADRADIEEVPLDAWELQFRVNVTGVFLMCKAAVRMMRRAGYGRIVNISSMSGLAGAPRIAAYSASKAAVLGLTRSIAMDVAEQGITVNAVCPGLVATSRAMTRRGDMSREDVIDLFGSVLVAGRPALPSDIANAVAWLADERSEYVTAQAFPIDGGGLKFPPLKRTDGS